jgi:hypothetical protein
MLRLASATVAAVALTGCFEAKEEAQSSSAYEQAKETAAVLKGDDKGAAKDNAVCALFKAKELEAYVGEPLGPPQNAAMGSGCQWVTKDDSGDVLIQIVSADYHEPHTLADGFRELPGVGEKGFVEKAYDGWSAGAISGEESIVAMVAGDKASAETAEALLRETIKRRANP